MPRMEKIKRTRNSESDRKSRVDALRSQTGLKLGTYSTTSLDARSVGGNIENFIGTISMPVGYVGSLNIHFKDDSKETFAPVATTEGALVSSMQRGSIALNLSGGVTARTMSSRMIRAPQYELESIDAALEFVDWISKNISTLKKLVKDKSNFAQLIEIDPKVFGRTVHLRFVFSTGNAAGQNMTTFCTSYLCQWINTQFPADTGRLFHGFIIEGNLSSDKKVSHLSAIEGRGRSVVAEATLKSSVIRKILKTTPQHLFQHFTRCKSGRVFSGMVGFNINVANAVAGLFLSTGQDMACVHESSTAELHMELKDEDIYVSLYMPSLVVGTVGGGTSLPAFRENIEMMGCYQVMDSANRLAETIASFALALEISTVSAISGGQFVDAHELLGRDLLKVGLSLKEIDEEFFKKSLSDDSISRVNKIEGQNKQGFVTDIAQQVTRKHTGIFAYEIERGLESKKAFLKIKPHDREIVLGSAKVLEILNPGLADLLVKRSEHLPFRNCHIREIEVLSKKNEVIDSMAPQFFGSFIDFNKEAFVLIQELIGNGWNISEIKDTRLWTANAKAEAIRTIARLHRQFLGDEATVRSLSDSILDMCSVDKMDEQLDLWDGLFTLSYAVLKSRHPELFQFYSDSLSSFESVLAEMNLQQKTLIHYDFNPRNIAFNPSGQVKVFDWEFSAWGLPQRDLIEFVIFANSESDVVQSFDDLSKMHYDLVYSDDRISYADWQRGCELSLQEFVVKRLAFYFILAELSFCPYIDRVLKNCEQLVGKFKS